jgi:hypothetical protein
LLQTQPPTEEGHPRGGLVVTVDEDAVVSRVVICDGQVRAAVMLSRTRARLDDDLGSRPGHHVVSIVGPGLPGEARA